MVYREKELIEDKLACSITVTNIRTTNCQSLPVEIDWHALKDANEAGMTYKD
jgi:hypothetical protein